MKGGGERTITKEATAFENSTLMLPFVRGTFPSLDYTRSWVEDVPSTGCNPFTFPHGNIKSCSSPFSENAGKFWVASEK